MGDAIQVVLAPRIDLHTGYHATFAGDERLSFALGMPDHVFGHTVPLDSPYSTEHLFEFLDATPLSGRVVQSARLPVLGAPGWIVDTDDLMAGPLCGRTFLDPAFQQRLAAWDDAAFIDRQRQRMRIMLAGYLHPSCSGILLRGEPDASFRIARTWFDRLEVAALGEQYLSKVVPIWPASAPINQKACDLKWRDGGRTTVLFCGRDFETKNGLMALRIFDRVAADTDGIDFVYIGAIPPGVLERFAGLRGRLTHHAALEHADVQERMLQARVFFHPSRFETVGIALVEAASHSMAIVTGCGRGLEYSRRLLTAGGAELIDRDVIGPAQEEAAFEHSLRRVLATPARARDMGLRNHANATLGPRSYAAQRRRLHAIYAESARQTGPVLALDALPQARGLICTRLTAAQLLAQEQRYCAQMKGRPLRVVM
ncbi:glycosyltransferase [Xanthomonas fragariae]|uniref:glycosyltransferase n=1 Tax=Xanthomonas fragariae TaxID=48664 RepID=UPI0022AA1F34|nr:glycosyltransferase [Xanthomonas fragariae]WAT14865.1 glycosyltransferase [Xanthomonas fragariae]